ncbi:hypothetical protein HPP92_019696 [Vanilla planifolia]|uniref:Uncharacterized protein n=1 Tax=Vanilla planifolia TaxID=51239 RepID=A0A835UJ57_VANPL|nr:hypothetical protein HPP92_019696 [Vanilla planifolia]
MSLLLDNPLPLLLLKPCTPAAFAVFTTNPVRCHWNRPSPATAVPAHRHITGYPVHPMESTNSHNVHLRLTVLTISERMKHQHKLPLLNHHSCLIKPQIPCAACCPSVGSRNPLGIDDGEEVYI